MSHYQRMKESLANIQEIRGGVASKLGATKEVLSEAIRAIQSNPDLSPAGKAKQIEQARKEVGKGFLSIAKEMKDNYQKNVISAKVAAEMLLNEKPKKPAVGSNEETFNRKFSDLKMQLMLETRANYAMDKLNSFIKEQKDPFLAQKIIDEYPGLVQTVLSAAGTERTKFKVELSRALENAKNVAITPEQREAADIFQAMEGEFNRELFRRGIEIDSVVDMFGREVAKFANNPDKFIDDEEGPIKVGNIQKLENENEIGKTKFLGESIHD